MLGNGLSRVIFSFQNKFLKMGWNWNGVIGMKVLLILNKENAQGLRIMVKVTKRSLKNRVVSLLENDRDKEAFELLIHEAEVDQFLPPNQKSRIRPDMTLIEDLL